jgi:hypothetical protein
MEFDADLDQVIVDAYGAKDVLYQWWVREHEIQGMALMGGECKTFLDVFIVFVLVCILLYVLTMIAAGAAMASTLVPAAKMKIKSVFTSVANITDINDQVEEVVEQIVLARKHVDIFKLTPLMAAGRLASSYLTILATNGATKFIQSKTLFKDNKDVSKSVVKFVKAKAFTVLTLTVGSVGMYSEYSAFLTAMNLVCSLFPSSFWKKEEETKFSSKVSESDASETSDPRNPMPKIKFWRKRGFYPKPMLQ